MLRYPGRAFRSVASEDTSHTHEGELIYVNPFEYELPSLPKHSKGAAQSTIDVPQPEPHSLKPSNRRWIALAACITATLPFFSLAWTAVGLHGREITQGSWNAIQIAMKVEVTLFPLLFAAIVGRMCRQLAHWNLQQGASVSTIQRFMGSTTVFGSIYTSWVLRSVDVIGLGLCLLWALSPLAAQSSLRILSADHGKTLSSPKLNYLNITGTAGITTLTDWKWTNDPGDEMFIGGLVTAKITKGSTTDLWGNVKVPLLGNLTSDTLNWTEVVGDNVVYTSQLGVPIFGLASNGSTSATVETSYLEFRCQDLHDRAFEGSNVSALAVPNIKYVNGTSTEAIVTWKSFNFVNSWSRDDKPVAEATCSVTSQSVVMDVSCNRTGGSTRSQGGCAATRIRKGQSDTTLPGIFSTPTIFDNFTSSILKAIPSGQYAAASVLDYWMANPYGSYPDFQANISLYELDPAVFSQRLTQMVNSFYVARLGYSFMTRTSLAGLQLSTKDSQMTVKSDTGSAVFASVTGDAVEVNSMLTLHINPGWITAFILTMVIMVAASILTFYLGSATLIPEILGYVSSLTRDNPHIPLGDVPVTVAGLKRARMLGSMYLRMGDVTPGEDLGTLGVGRLSSTIRSKARRLFR